jgi:hypothetical protein
VSVIDPTCLPWQTMHDNSAEGYTTVIGNVDGEIIDGTTHHSYDFVARTLDVEDDSQSWSIAAANARFIVRACNSHYKLLRLVEAVVLEWDQYADGNEWPSADDAVRIMDALWRQDFFKSARAAIAETKGGAL